MTSQTTDFSPLSASKRDRLQYVLPSALTLHNAPACLLIPRKSNALIYWNAEQFNLHQVKLFQTASQAQKQAILQITTRDILDRAYEIETFGMRYCDRAIALGNTLQERTLYSIFKAENTLHLAQIACWLNKKELGEFEPVFFPFLTDFIDTQNLNVLRFVMQVVLEGWELSSYRKFLKDCREEKVISAVKELLKNKSRHHTMGTTLSKQSFLLEDDSIILIEILAEFISAIQKLPYHLIDAIEQILGHLAPVQKQQAIAELEIVKYNAMQLKRLRFLISKARSGKILTELEARGCFQVVS
ncbi:hypothetical protein [Spirulina sp. 06S082]|uniref:hypothetical protein n=1 Tax=Spirulina sp. 06S082 TaxID=3110248 RepID=UPI002B1F8619|nr:hypothetical protein [Spirulina sp. 06S082]MEA5469562.1 hypothetical protein [Spirulina sp. 06S082]